MKKIGVIGDKDSVLCFKAAGFTVFITEDGTEAENIIKKAEADGFAVIFITEHLLKEITDTADRFKSNPNLSIIPIPGRNGSLGIGMAAIKKSVEKAVGADILK